MKAIDHIRIWMPSAAALLYLAMLLLIPDSQVVVSKEFYTKVVLCFIAVLVLAGVASYPVVKVREFMVHRGPWIFVLFIVLGVYEVATLKLNLLPLPFFPSVTKISETFMSDYEKLGLCILASCKTLFWGFLVGTLLGIVNGVLLGLFKKVEYWIGPIFQFVGPTPPAALAPLALIILPNSFTAACFLIVFSVWYPVTVQTWSGVSNLSKDYFEVARTLGGSRAYQLRHIVAPGILPTIFYGIYIGFCYSFMTLIVADMMGSSFGLGWFINWAMGWGAYYKLYAALFIICILCCFLIQGMFKLRDRMLRWQGEGVSV